MRALIPRPLASMWPEFEELFGKPFEWQSAVPPVDVEETDEAYVVTAELPGFDKKDIEIELKNNILTLKGEKIEREGRKFLRRERAKNITRFARSFRLPSEIAHDQVTAEFKKGELVITLPKSEADKGYKIPLN